MNFYYYLRQPIESVFFLYFLFLNLISNGACLSYYNDAKHLFFVVVLSFLYAYIESALYKLLFYRWLKRIYIFFISLLLNIFIITDFFLIFNFHIPFYEDIADIVLETNAREMVNFFESYLSISSLIGYLSSLFFINILIWYISKRLSSYFLPSLTSLSFFLVLIGLSVFFYMGYSFVFYRNGMSIPQLASITRFYHTINVVRDRIVMIHRLQVVCDSTEATCGDPTKPTVAVIIGESHSLYHSSLYGYPLDTNPLLHKRFLKGNLFLFDNVVTIDDHTHGAIKSVFSLDSLNLNFDKVPLFPQIFKAAGYYTVMLDNQYMVGKGISFLSDKKLSDSMFDKRNNTIYNYDGDLVDEIEVKEEPSLYVIHLWGQHYTYKNRYPEEYNIFSSKDYDGRDNNLSQKTVIAQYDNACLYNDYVIDQILSKFENKNAIVFYLSDHGEEIYEQRDFIGHGDAVYSPDLRYQIRVPFLIFVSDSFKLTHEDLCHQFKASQHKPIITDDISHVILNSASIQSLYFSPERCFTNPNYKEKKPRMVLHSIDYNQFQ